MFEVYHFREKTDTLFRTYIDKSLKVKQESSGWPQECDSDETRESYVKSYKLRENVTLNPDEIEKNPGRRQVAKLALNSFWGR